MYGDHVSLAVARYDRKHVAGDVTRVHQEDMFSALGVTRGSSMNVTTSASQPPAAAATPPDPVRSDRGPTLDDMAALIERHLGRAGLVRFIEVVAFNVAIGNADAHARNLSFLLGRDGTVRFAPLYDLVSTGCYRQLNSEWRST